MSEPEHVCESCQRLRTELEASVKGEEVLYRQFRRQVDVILILCERLRDAGLSDKISPEEKPRIRTPITSATEGNNA